MPGLTLAERIISEHAVATPGRVQPGQIVVAAVDLAIAQDGTGPLAIQQLADLGAERVATRAVFFV
ncbi:MAG: 3-isopropylmalate dehydratase large subunit, partial [Actinobacteria bacterium]|nr:3-isopropylmalate dehydratase large subunit [Actinomycetota bacterium]